MQIKHKFLTPLLIFLVLLCITGFSILTIGKAIVNKDFVQKIGRNIDLVTILEEDETLNNLFEEKRIPKEALKNIDETDAKKLIQQIIDSLYSNESSIITSSDINSLIRDSILKYENMYIQDIYNNIEQDINEYSNSFANSINDQTSIEFFRLTYNVTNGIIYYLIILLGITFIYSIILLEKKESTFILGIIMTMSSLTINYVKEEVLKNLLNDKSIIELIGKNNIIEISNSLRPIYLILFLIGIILLIIYAILLIKKILIKVKLSKYDRYGR